MRRACCALTRRMSMGRAPLMEFFTAVDVISLNTMRHLLLSSRLSTCARCQLMASPSRSGSVARNTFSADFASLRMRSNTSPLPRRVMYFGSKLLSIFTPSWLLGRSRTCPLDATTLYLLPKNLPIVFAFAGDSTMTSVSDIAFLPPEVPRLRLLRAIGVEIVRQLLHYSEIMQFCQAHSFEIVPICKKTRRFSGVFEKK